MCGVQASKEEVHTIMHIRTEFPTGPTS
ncbi:hypothetical protein LINGRAHAP2_LOCUS7500 [Linum grandiflorum]